MENFRQNTANEYKKDIILIWYVQENQRYIGHANIDFFIW